MIVLILMVIAFGASWLPLMTLNALRCPMASGCALGGCGWVQGLCTEARVGAVAAVPRQGHLPLPRHVQRRKLIQEKLVWQGVVTLVTWTGSHAKSLIEW